VVTATREHSYTPVGSALELFRCRAPEVLLSGPAGTGKSRAALEKLHAACLMTPNVRCLVVRKTAASLGSTALETFREHVAKEALASGEVRFYSGSQEKPAAYMYGNGSVIVIGGMDKSTRIMSSEYDLAFVQEAIELTEDNWEAITTRLRNGVLSFQQLIADTNPGPPQHWLKGRCDQGKCVIVYCRHEDNPRLYTGGAWTTEGLTYLSKLDALTGVRRLRLRFGKWAAAEGLVYDGFDPEIHISDAFSWKSVPPADWPRYHVVDFGYTNPFVYQWWVADPDGRLYMYREIYHTKRLVEDHAEQILKFRKVGRATEIPPVFVVADHDAEGRATLEKHLGLSTRPAHKAVQEGIEAVAARLKIAGDGKPRLFWCREAVVERDPDLVDAHVPSCTAEEVPGYVWPPKRPGEPDRPKDVLPVKKDDHGADCARYLVSELDMGVTPRLRFLPQ
jgi:Phage terminase large subunit